MTELGQINPEKKMGCPHCNAIIPDGCMEALINEETVYCLSCGEQIRLPERVIEQLKVSKFVGRNFDLTI